MCKTILPFGSKVCFYAAILLEISALSSGPVPQPMHPHAVLQGNGIFTQAKLAQLYSREYGLNLNCNLQSLLYRTWIESCIQLAFSNMLSQLMAPPVVWDPRVSSYSFCKLKCRGNTSHTEINSEWVSKKSTENNIHKWAHLYSLVPCVNAELVDLRLGHVGSLLCGVQLVLDLPEPGEVGVCLLLLVKRKNEWSAVCRETILHKMYDLKCIYDCKRQLNVPM